MAAILGSSVVALDATVVNVALPAIRDELGGGLQTQQWISNAYLLTLGALILTGGSLGDIFGRRRIFAIGVGGFGFASLVCALAPSSEVLILGRALQGVAGALLAPSSLAVIAAAFPERERAAAVGSWTAWGGIALVIGPLAGGLVVDRLSWRWIFALNLPLTLLTLALLRAVEADARQVRRRVDLVGAGLGALGLAGIVIGLIEQPRHGWSSAFVRASLVGGGLALAAFVAYERHAQRPMLPLELFQRRNFTIANVQTLSIYAGLAVLFFFLSIFLQQSAGWSAVRAGLITVPVSVTMFVLSRWVGRLADRHGPRIFLTCGPLLAATGVALLLRVDLQASFVGEVLPALIVFSLGLAATVAPLTATVLAEADQDDAGIASAINNAIARVAGLVGISAIGALVVSRLPAGAFAPNAASVDALHLALAACAVLLASAGVLAALASNPREAGSEPSSALPASLSALHSRQSSGPRATRSAPIAATPVLRAAVTATVAEHLRGDTRLAAPCVKSSLRIRVKKQNDTRAAQRRSETRPPTSSNVPST